MVKICFATNNTNKLQEIKKMLGGQFEILSLADIGCVDELPENQKTLEGNSEEKARYVAEHFKIDCFADDTGLEVDALNGQPGVYSARFAGPRRNNIENMSLLLKKLDHTDVRSAQFRTVITLIINSHKVQFEGIVRGNITSTPRGEQGFGYDPVFIPLGSTHTFAELSMEEKNKISHRGIAFKKLVDYLQKNLL